MRTYKRIHTIGGYLLIGGALMINGCAQSPQSIGSQGDVSLIAPGERTHIKDKLTPEDFIALADTVTEKMLSSSKARSWATRKKKPLLVVAAPENTTHDANIITEDLQDEIIAKILDSDIARVVDESSVSSNYDYVIKTTITSTMQSGERGSKLTYYTCKLQMFTLRGERLGQWHDKIGMATPKRGLLW